MSTTSVEKALENTVVILEKGGSESQYLSNIAELSCIVHTVTDLNQVPYDKSEWDWTAKYCDHLLNKAFSTEPILKENKELYIRVVRGVIIILRNLLPLLSVEIGVSSIIKSITKFVENSDQNSTIFKRCLTSYLELLANVMIKEGPIINCSISEVSRAFDQSTLQTILRSRDKSIIKPFCVFIGGLVKSEENVCSMLAIKSRPSFVFCLFEESHSPAHLEEYPLLMEILEKFIVHADFRSFVQMSEISGNMRSVLEVCQYVITANDEWNSKESSSMIGWCFPLFINYSETATSLLCSNLEDNKSLESIHFKLVKILDIISHLCKFHGTKCYLEAHDAIYTIVHLLRAVQENTSVKTLSSPNPINSSSSPRRENKKTFPIIKSILIEILTYICSDSFSSQERMRELHGLELVLSNFVIDDDNPFIKERSTVCLRMLLAKNTKNQQVISELEAQDIAKSDVLEDANCKIELKDGKIQYTRGYSKTNCTYE